MIFYEIVRRTCAGLFRLTMRVRVEGKENVPVRGGFILLMNHESVLDPMLVHSLAPRQVFSMTKSTQFRTRFMRWILPRVGAFPTRRYQVDPQTVRVALRYIEEGRGVGIFPEGERSWDGRLQPLRLGTIRLVLKAGVPVIPCGVIGAYEVGPRWDDFPTRRLLFGRVPVTLRYGAPLEFGRHDERSDREACLEEALERITRALEEVSAA